MSNQLQVFLLTKRVTTSSIKSRTHEHYIRLKSQTDRSQQHVNHSTIFRITSARSRPSNIDVFPSSISLTHITTVTIRSTRKECAGIKPMDGNGSAEEGDAWFGDTWFGDCPKLGDLPLFRDTHACSNHIKSKHNWN